MSSKARIFNVPSGNGPGFNFTCTWDNTTSTDVNFGESATNEMCFFWAYYYPSKGAQVCVKAGNLVSGCCPNDPTICSVMQQFLAGN